MWGLANLARLLGWFLALLYSECLAALARPRVLPESLPPGSSKVRIVIARARSRPRSRAS